MDASPDLYIVLFSNVPKFHEFDWLSKEFGSILSQDYTRNQQNIYSFFKQPSGFPPCIFM